ncbi:mitochondrial carrier homolog 2-like [Babylonia areolata]|uniref:mitochondrial carrier homolog 2-like n=1 Tax=Babylonia areolata TaxID=304850 RepID=UPI003FD1E265
MAAITLAQYGTGAFVTTALHPLGYAKVLIQAGYEPLPPTPSVSLFGKESLIYPNVLQYISHIHKVDGFSGLYRGLFPRVLSGTLGNFVQNSVAEKLKVVAADLQTRQANEGEEEDELAVWLKGFCIDTTQETISRCCGIVASHPLQVITVRCMLQFVGRETTYDSVFSSIREIYDNDGILGFFAGLMPRLVGEVLMVWVTNFLARLLNRYLVEEKDMKSYTAAACGLVVSHFTYPFTLTSNIMAVNGSGLVAASPPRMPRYDNWLDCFSDLGAKGQLKRGASMFWRYYHGPVIYREGKIVAAPRPFGA